MLRFILDDRAVGLACLDHEMFRTAREVVARVLVRPELFYPPSPDKVGGHAELFHEIGKQAGGR